MAPVNRTRNQICHQQTLVVILLVFYGFTVTCRPVQKVKARYIKVSEPNTVPENLKVPSHLDANYGDVLAWGDYRDSDTYIVGNNDSLIKNPDYSAAGYLSIPAEITEGFTDAVWRYSDIQVNDIALRFDDDYIKEHLGRVPSDWKFTFLPSEEELVAEFPNGKSLTFVANEETVESLKSWYEGSQKPQSSFKISYRFEGPAYISFKEKHSTNDYIRPYPQSSVLPSTWKSETLGGSSGRQSVNGQCLFTGPKDDEDKVREAIAEYYKGFEEHFSFL